MRAAQRVYRTWSLDSRRWDRYAPRPDDIVIATAPKCGTTWMQQIVASLVFQEPNRRPIPAVSPWVEARFRQTEDELYAVLEAQSHRRFLKTHLPVDGLPIFDEVRYIHVARDGRDTLLSMHNHFTGFSEAQLEVFDRIGREDPLIGAPYPRLPSDPAEFLALWLTKGVVPGQDDGFPAPSFFELERGYWAHRRRSNFLLVHYTDLKRDLDGEMRRVAAFLDIEVDEARWPALVAGATFESMRSAGGEIMPQTRTLLRGGADQFFRKGALGDWRAELSEADLSAYDARVRERLTPALAHWLACGREGGDPRGLGD